MIAIDPVDLRSYDLILVNTSGGKDSALTASHIRQLAEALDVLDRVLLVHATFPEEWPGTVDLVRRQALALGLPIEVASRGEALLDYVRRRRKWPGLTRQARYCTSDFKRAPIDRVINRPDAAAALALPSMARPQRHGHPRRRVTRAGQQASVPGTDPGGPDHQRRSRRR